MITEQRGTRTCILRACYFVCSTLASSPPALRRQWLRGYYPTLAVVPDSAFSWVQQPANGLVSVFEPLAQLCGEAYFGIALRLLVLLLHDGTVKSCQESFLSASAPASDILSSLLKSRKRVILDVLGSTLSTLVETA